MDEWIVLVLAAGRDQSCFGTSSSEVTLSEHSSFLFRNYLCGILDRQFKLDTSAVHDNARARDIIWGIVHRKGSGVAVEEEGNVW